MSELKCILHVDDDGDILELSKMALELVGGLEVHQCRSADEALERIVQIGPDLLLLDGVMPGVDGPTLLAMIREIEGFQTVPAVFMTAKSIDMIPDTKTASGVIGVISKPFDPLELSNLLRQFWAERALTPG